jgi:hypothetical protein
MGLSPCTRDGFLLPCVSSAPSLFVHESLVFEQCYTYGNVLRNSLTDSRMHECSPKTGPFFKQRVKLQPINTAHVVRKCSVTQNSPYVQDYRLVSVTMLTAQNLTCYDNFFCFSNQAKVIVNLS